MVNNAAMKITILGSGTCVPNLKRYPCSALVQTEFTTVLLDIGPGIIGQLMKLGVHINDIDMICLSHFHLDHCADLAPFIFATKYPGFKRSKKLTLAGGTSIFELYSNLNKAYGHSLEMPESMFQILELEPLQTRRLDINGLNLSWTGVAHKPESLAYRFSDPTSFSFVYSGDTDFSQNLIELATGADLMICESAMPDDQKVAGHLTPSIAGDMAHRAGVKKLVLTHLYPECERSDFLSQCRHIFKGPVLVAQDLMAL